MIFGNNTTTLNSVSVPMAEGYENYGIELSFIESARNDYAMFKAMLEADYKEMSICKESAGVVMEGEVAALHEAVGGGIFKKIADLFKKLIAKIKAILHNFMARINSLFMKDSDYVKKYYNELSRKRLDNLEIKWFEKKDGKDIDAMLAGYDRLIEGSTFENSTYHNESWERIKQFLPCKSADNETEAHDEIVEDALGGEDTVELKEIGGWRTLTAIFDGGKKNLDKVKKSSEKMDRELGKLVKVFDKKAKDLSNADRTGAKVKDDDGNEHSVTQEMIDDANHDYDLAVAYQAAVNIYTRAMITALTKSYKYAKAGLVKAITVNPKKIEESAVYAQAIAEAAEDEVEDVITGALSKSELEDLSAASTNVKDADVKDDPDALTYGPDRYNDNAPMDTKDGEIDTEINSKEESAFFGKMFY